MSDEFFVSCAREADVDGLMRAVQALPIAVPLSPDRIRLKGAAPTSWTYDIEFVRQSGEGVLMIVASYRSEALSMLNPILDRYAESIREDDFEGIEVKFTDLMKRARP